MKMKSFGLAGLLTLAACSVGSGADRLEEVVGDQLANQGTVEEVTFTAQDENRMTGHAMLRDASGQQRRMNCTARRTSGSSFDWNCTQAIDEALLQQMEGMIRETMTQQGEVIEVELQRAGDDDNMAGHVVVRGSSGEQIRATWRAVRDRPGGAFFSWRCDKGAEAWAEERSQGSAAGGDE